MPFESPNTNVIVWVPKILFHSYDKLVEKKGIPTMLCYTARRRQMFLADHLSFDKICNKSLLRIKSTNEFLEQGTFLSRIKSKNEAVM